MDKLVAKVRQELASLRKVAHHLHTPLNTSGLEKAVEALAAAATARPRREKPVERPVEKAETPPEDKGDNK